MRINNEGVSNVSYNLNVHHPPCYNHRSIECTDIIRAITACMNPYEAFLTGRAIECIWRCNLLKSNSVEDIEKAIWYINKIIENRTEEHADVVH